MILTETKLYIVRLVASITSDHDDQSGRSDRSDDDDHGGDYYDHNQG